MGSDKLVGGVTVVVGLVVVVMGFRKFSTGHF